jgi:hypothetical protein
VIAAATTSGWAQYAPTLIVTVAISVGLTILKRVIKSVGNDFDDRVDAKLEKKLDEKLDEKLKPIKEQFGNNGGKSLRDAVDATRSDVAKVKSGLEAHVAFHRGQESVRA